MKFYSFCLRFSGFFGFVAYKTVRKSVDYRPGGVRQNRRKFCKGKMGGLFKNLHFPHIPFLKNLHIDFFQERKSKSRPGAGEGRFAANFKAEISNRTGVFLFLLLTGFSFASFGKEKVLDLGEIEITGEVRRPNINLIYSKKYIKRAVNIIAREEFKKLESDLLKPSLRLNKGAVIRKRNDIKTAGKTNQGIAKEKTRHLKPQKRTEKSSSEKKGIAKGGRVVK